MRQRRLTVALAILALLLQALGPFGSAWAEPAGRAEQPGRAEPAVICGAAGPVVILLDLRTGQPARPPAGPPAESPAESPAEPPAEPYSCCSVCVQCGGCPVPVAATGAALPAASPAAASAPAHAPQTRTGAAQRPVRARGPPARATRPTPA